MAELNRLNAQLIKLEGGVESELNLLQLKAALTNEIQKSKNDDLVIDLEKLTTFNSQVLSLLLCGLRTAHKSQCRVRFDNMPPGLFDMARVGGLDSVLPRSL